MGGEIWVEERVLALGEAPGLALGLAVHCPPPFGRPKKCRAGVLLLRGER